MLEPDWTDSKQGSRLPSTIVMKSVVGPWPHRASLREVRAHCKAVARRSLINLVSAFLVAKCKSSDIHIVIIWERIDKIMEQEEETSSQKPADLETWRLRVWEAFADLFEPPTGVSPASKHNFCINTDPTAKPAHREPDRMSDSERLEFETHVAKLPVNGWVTATHTRFAAPVIFFNSRMALDCWCGLITEAWAQSPPETGILFHTSKFSLISLFGCLFVIILHLPPRGGAQLSYHKLADD